MNFIMKKYLSIPAMLLLASLGLTGCGSNTPQPTPIPTATVRIITAGEVDVLTQKWVMAEMSFESAKAYANPFYDASIDVAFTAPDGTKMVMPGFWDGGSTWKVRFAPTQCGIWTYTTACSDASDSGLNGKSGTLGCNPYTGDKAVYQHGFVKTDGKKYFVYDDGTPFFYLGDTHWFLPHERFETSNVDGIASQFKYIVDKRVEQHFTVYQSEPIMTGHKGSTEEASYDLSSFEEVDLDGFRNLDRKFQYIADAGLVHANAEIMAAWLLAGESYTPEYIERLVRCWVARYSAYSVLWTTAQEVDAYGYGGSKEALAPNYENWVLVANLTAKLDPYSHPITAHMASQVVDSSFAKLECHSWYGLQWSFERNASLPMFDFKYGYLKTDKPIVLYESRYDGFWETNYKFTRNQGYTAWLLGMYGHGYGANGLWNDIYSKRDVGCALLGKEDTFEETWYDGISSPGGEYMQYMAQFYTSLEWWKLVPRFDDTAWFQPEKGTFYVLASDGDNTFVAYFYNETKSTGTLKGMAAGAAYTVKWYDVRTGQYQEAGTVTADENGSCAIGEKPDQEDWILLVKKK